MCFDKLNNFDDFLPENAVVVVVESLAQLLCKMQTKRKKNKANATVYTNRTIGFSLALDQAIIASRT